MGGDFVPFVLQRCSAALGDPSYNDEPADQDALPPTVTLNAGGAATLQGTRLTLVKGETTDDT